MLFRGAGSTSEIDLRGICRFTVRFAGSEANRDVVGLNLATQAEAGMNIQLVR